jgi:cytochrome b561
MRVSRNEDGTRAPFDFLTISLHWLVVLLILVLATTGLAFAYLPAMVNAPFLVGLHRAAGSIVWVITLLRLFWRQTRARFPPFPERMPQFQQRLATLSEHMLYLLLIVQPILGLAMSLSLGRPFWLLAWNVPALAPRNLELWLTLLELHRLGAYALFLLASGHGIMALVHHYVLRDDVLEMMAPWMRRKPLVLKLAREPVATDHVELCSFDVHRRIPILARPLAPDARRNSLRNCLQEPPAPGAL